MRISSAAQLGPRIKGLRLRRGLTRRAVVARLDVTENALSNWEGGRRRPDDAVLERLAAILGDPELHLVQPEEHWDRWLRAQGQEPKAVPARAIAPDEQPAPEVPARLKRRRRKPTITGRWIEWNGRWKLACLTIAFHHSAKG